MYYMPSGTPHAPTTLGFHLLHFISGGRTTQLAFINGTSNNYYIRSKNTSTLELSAWRRIATDDDLIFKAGEKISVDSTWVNGTLTNANKSIYILIPTRKPISGSLSFVPTSLSVRQGGKYLAESISSFSGYDFDIIKAGDTGVRIRMERTGGWGGVNNEAVAVALDGNIVVS